MYSEVCAVVRARAMQSQDLELYRALVEQAPDAMIFADPEGTIRLWNAKAEAIFGYTAGEAIGRNLDLIIPENLRAAHWRGYHRSLTEGHTKSGGKAMVTRAAPKATGKLYVEMAFEIIRDPSQHVSGALATARDITERYLAERARRTPQPPTTP
ncbi:MAG: PAS domain S-box protein [Pseudolabrys sp.]